MRILPIAALGFALVSTASFADCTAPASAVLPADGAKASLEEMIEGQKAVKTFQTANLEYMSCLTEKMNTAEAAAKDGDDKAKAAAQAEHTAAVEAYNKAVTEEEKLAGDFNTALKAYKGAQNK